MLYTPKSPLLLSSPSVFPPISSVVIVVYPHRCSKLPHPYCHETISSPLLLLRIQRGKNGLEERKKACISGRSMENGALEYWHRRARVEAEFWNWRASMDAYAWLGRIFIDAYA
ncbi:uncharacterized protein DS421_13g416080 [Arachis hypogaea]|nr:uncharacterized protein DS421_13g416080 [Arachis hypogaea]